MKKLVILIAALVSANLMMAQKTDRTNAYMYNKNGQLEKAKESIDKCTSHQSFTGMKPKDQAQAWMYAGMIYLNIHMDPNGANIDPNALETSYQAFVKCIEIDPAFVKQNEQDIYSRVAAIGGQFFAKGVDGFNTGNFGDGALAFKRAYEVSLTTGATDTLALVNAALSSLKAHEYNQAIDLYTSLQSIGYNDVDTYKNMAAAYNGLNNEEKTLEMIALGLEKFPGDPGLIIEKVNIYLKQGKGSDAVQDLNKLLELDPNNKSILFILGTIYGDDTKEIFDSNKAVEYYKAAVEVDPEYYDAIYNLGALYISLSNQLKSKANDLPLEAQKEYKDLIDQAKGYIQEGLPFVQRAYEIQSTPEVKAVLKTMFIQLDMKDEAAALDAE